MLPFLKARKLDSVVTMQHRDDGTNIPMDGEGENHAHMAVAEDLIRAIHAKDAKAVSEALMASHDISAMGDMGPEEEMGEE